MKKDKQTSFLMIMMMTNSEDLDQFQPAHCDQRLYFFLQEQNKDRKNKKKKKKKNTKKKNELWISWSDSRCTGWSCSSKFGYDAVLVQLWPDSIGILPMLSKKKTKKKKQQKKTNKKKKKNKQKKKKKQWNKNMILIVQFCFFPLSCRYSR